MILCCVYDNPDTMSRECWQDGHIIRSYSAHVLCQKQPIPPAQFFFGANIGPWKTGQLIGDPRAMEKKER